MMTEHNLRILAFLVFSVLLFYTFGPLLRGLKRYRQNDEDVKWTLCLFGLIGLIPLVLIDLYMWFLFLLVFPVYPHYSFDKVDWKTDVQQRFTMADDLVDSKQLIGLTKSEVSELLGKPYREWEATDHTIRYEIGERPTAGFDADPDELVIDLKEGKVVNCYLQPT